MNLRALSRAILIAALPAIACQGQPQLLRNSTQLIAVTTSGWDSVEGRLQRYERPTAADAWKPVGEAVTIVVGRHGMAWGRGLISTENLRQPHDPVKQEGDGRSPAGIFPLTSAFGYAAHAPAVWKMPYIAVTAGVECVDDSASTYYNRVLDRASVTPDWHSSEKMAEAGDAYRWGAIIAQNSGNVPRGGSCVFLHIWGGPGVGTAGCTAMPQDQLEPILAWLDPSRHPLIVELPESQYRQLKARSSLPAIP